MTSPVLKINICESCDCTELIFSELTGTYNSVSNPGGYGTPNVNISDIVSAILTVKISDNTYTIDLFAHGFPTTDTEFAYLIPNEDIGYTTGVAIPDGIMTFIYTLTDNSGNTYSSTVYKGFTCNTKCCVLSMLKDIDWTCDCSKNKIDNWLSAWGLYQAMLASIGCGNISAFNNQLSQVSKLCKNTGCKDCN